MEWLLLWLFMVSPKIVSGLGFLGFAMLLICFAHFLWYLLNESIEDWKPYKKTLVAAVIIIFLSNMIPEKKDIALIVAGGVTYNALTSETAKEIGGKGLSLLNKKLEEYLENDAVEDVKSTVKEKILKEEVVKEAVKNEK